MIVEHLVGFLYWVAIVVCPVPLCLSLFLTPDLEENAPNFAHSLLLVLTGWCALEAGVGLISGIIQSFTQPTVLTLNLLLFSFGVVFLVIKNQFSLLHILITSIKPAKKLNKFEVIVLAATASVAVFLLFESAVQPINNYDSLAYHLPTMVQWYQNHSFAYLEEFKFNQIGRYPYTWEVLCALFFIPFREDFLISFPNIIAWLILGLSIYLISIKLGATRLSSLASTSMVLMLPILIESVNTIHVDLPLASFFIAGFYFAILCAENQQISYLALVAIAIGMLTGIKTSGLIYSAVLVLILAFLLAQYFVKEKRLNLISRRPPKSSIVLILLSTICLLGLGGFWYLRNYLELGNPLGYIEVNVGGITLFVGNVDIDQVRETTLANLFNITSFANWKTLGGQIKAKLGFPFLFLALQVILFFWLSLRSKIQGKAKLRVVVGLFFLLFVTGFLYWTTPYSADNGGANGQITFWIGQAIRYAFPCLSILGILAAVVSTSITPHLKPFGFQYEQVLVMGVIASIVSLFDLRIIVLLGVSLLLIKLIQFNGFYRFANGSLKSRALVAIAVLVFLVSSSSLTRELRDINRVKTYGEAVNYFETINPNETLGYTSTYASYIFYGKHWDKQAVSVTPEEISYNQWLTLLKQKKIGILSVGPKLKTMQAEEIEWLKKPDAPFVQVLGQNPDREAVLYRLK